MKSWFKNKIKSNSINQELAPKVESRKLVPINRTAGKGHLVRMLNEGIIVGAKEVFVGYPQNHSYRYVAQGEQFSGILPDSALQVIRELTAVRSPITLDWEDVEVKELKVGISRGASRPVYCFSWHQNEDLILPIREDNTAPPSIPAPVRKLVMIVDDDNRFCSVLSRILEEQGFLTLIAHDGRDGLEKLRSNVPEIIITDIHMPNLTGPELLLEGRRRGINAPYLVLTNDEDALTEAELILLGATAFIRKSEDPRVLLAWCRRLTNVKALA
jgi:CheY-like chemotaxis protein